MNTPIVSFIDTYVKTSPMRLHMPGHKGGSILGVETIDLTEIKGLDSLYDGTGVIRESEENASSLFGAHTAYSTEGSSLCIRAMLALICKSAAEKGEKALIFATRNVHKSFLSGVALLDMDVSWLIPSKEASYLSAFITPTDLDKALSSAKTMPHGVYITSPDYLGNVADIEGLATVCHSYGVPLVVDNAHGAYLKFLPTSRHPIDLGADMCCDSAHKTLPALTGAAYLHLSHTAPSLWKEGVKDAMALFASTSPSFLILQSLDLLNPYLAETYENELKAFLPQVDGLKQALSSHGYTLLGEEELKITIDTKAYGYTGDDFANLLRENGMECEFSDPDYVVLMLTPALTGEDMEKLKHVLLSIPKREALLDAPPAFSLPKSVLTVREATFARDEVILASEALGRTLATTTVACPPAVPIIMCGEVVDQAAVEAFQYYGTKTVRVIK